MSRKYQMSFLASIMFCLEIYCASIGETGGTFLCAFVTSMFLGLAVLDHRARREQERLNRAIEIVRGRPAMSDLILTIDGRELSFPVSASLDRIEYLKNGGAEVYGTLIPPTRRSVGDKEHHALAHILEMHRKVQEHLRA